MGGGGRKRKEKGRVEIVFSVNMIGRWGGIWLGKAWGVLNLAEGSSQRTHNQAKKYMAKRKIKKQTHSPPRNVNKKRGSIEYKPDLKRMVVKRKNRAVVS